MKSVRPRRGRQLEREERSRYALGMSWLRALRSLTAPRAVRAELRRLRGEERAVRLRLGALARAERLRLRGLAAELVPLRERILALTARPRCCTRCAAPTPWGGEALPGGLCCSGTSEAIFNPVELAPLVLAGRAPSDHAVAPSRAGCLFRGAAGCLLPAGSRPSLCLGHLCRELAAELHGRGVIPELLELAEELAARGRAIGEALGLEP